MLKEKEVKEVKDLNKNFAGYYGTENYYKHCTGNNFTDGVKAMAEKYKAFWLIDVVFSYQYGKAKKVPFQIWEIVTNDSFKATVEMKEDTGQPILVRQKIPYTDFPEGIFKMYYINNVLLLPSEY